MKIAILGAHGKAGYYIAKEAEKKGHDVLAIVRKKHHDEFKNTLEKDLMDITKDDLKDVDVVINAVSAWTPETFFVHTDGISHLASLLEDGTTKFLMMGGAGTLYVNPEHSMMMMDQPDYPEQLKPLAAALRANLDRIRSFSNIPWTYVTPPYNLDYEGEETGEYVIGGEEFFKNDKGESYISYKDFAKAMIEIAEKDYTRRRVSVVGK